MKRTFIVAVITVAIFLFALVHHKKPDYQPMNHELIQKIVEKYQSDTLGDFNSFKKSVKENFPNTSIGYSLAHESRALGREKLNEKDQINIYRLLGTYTQIKYKDEIINTLGEMVAINTADKKYEGYKPYEDPDIISFGKLVERYASDFGLAYRNVDNRVFEVTLPATIKSDSVETFGVYTHADIVPANPATWATDPFKIVIKDGKIYGRGTEDDKCSIAVTLYAMKVIKENNFPLKRNIRLIIETTEETSGAGFDYYLEKEGGKLPDVNIVLDSSYPMVTAEKGTGSIYIYLREEKAGSNLPVILNMTGGTAINQIPGFSEVLISSAKKDELKKMLEEKSKAYCDPEHSGHNGFKIEISDEGKNIKLNGIGVSAHSSQPEEGLNPIVYMVDFLNTCGVKWVDNHWGKAIKYLYDLYGTDYYGEKFGIAWQDTFMGPFTLSPTYFKLESGKLKVGVNIRSPRGKEPDTLKKEIISKLEAYKKNSAMSFDYEVNVQAYMYRDPKGQWIQTLLDIFGSVTGKEAKPVSSAGGTTAKQMPRAVSFGPSMPGEKYMGHNDNEFKKVDNLLFDVQMFTEMFVRVGNLESM